MTQNTDTPQLSTIYLNPTERCNLRCMHCWINPEYSRSGFQTVPPLNSEISASDVKNIIIQALPLGLKAIKLTGGEPFLRDDIFEIMETICVSGLSIHIETNASLLDEKKIKKIKKMNLARVSVSLDAASPALHDEFRGVRESFEKTLNVIKLLLKFRLNTEVIFSLHSKNIRDFPDFIGLMYKTGVNNIKVNTLIPSGRATAMRRRGMLPTINSILRLNKYVEKFSNNKLNINMSIPIVFKSISRMMAEAENQCNIFSILGILSNGDISICGIGRVEKDLVLGNIKTDKLGEIWREHPVLLRIRQGIPGELKGICKRCLMKALCLGFCRANAYSVSHDLYAPYYLCEEAFKKGLFPASRLI